MQLNDESIPFVCSDWWFKSHYLNTNLSAHCFMGVNFFNKNPFFWKKLSRRDFFY